MLSHKAKWLERDGADDAVDAATRDLRTDDNALSVWCCDPARPATLDNVVIALASNREKVDRLDIVILNANDLMQANLSIIEKPGNTPADTLNPDHRDVAGFTLPSLVEFARHVHRVARIDALSLRFAVKEVRALLHKAIVDGVLQPDRLNPKLAAELSAPRPPAQP
jgi:hypothetical protein